MAHFTNIIMRIDDDAYNPTIAPLVNQWKPPRGFSKPGHYRAVIDLLDLSHVIWRLYERRRHITPFQDICWYSGWIMVGRDIMVRHLPERVLRQYGYGQTQPRPPTEIEALGQMMWPRPSQSLLYMSSAINRGVIRFRITSRRVNLGGT